MKRQINYILMQTVLWGGWICEYIWFLKHQFQMRFDLWVFVAYLFLLYLCVVRKLGNNNNRRYEIYMELWGRLTAVNVVWYLFVGAKTVHFAGILLVLWKLILLSTIQCITFAGILQIYKKIMEHFQITTACVITRENDFTFLPPAGGKLCEASSVRGRCFHMLPVLSCRGENRRCAGARFGL